MSRDFIRPIEYVNIGKYNHSETRDRGIRLYCTSAPETHGADNARYALQVFAPLHRHDGSEGKGYMIASASLSKADLIALRVEVHAAIAEVEAADPHPKSSSRKAIKSTPSTRLINSMPTHTSAHSPDKRYCSGTSITRTSKEMLLDRIEQRLGDFTDTTYLDMKKLTVATLKELDKLLER